MTRAASALAYSSSAMPPKFIGRLADSDMAQVYRRRGAESRAFDGHSNTPLRANPFDPRARPTTRTIKPLPDSKKGTGRGSRESSRRNASLRHFDAEFLPVEGE